jgi:hypothetical protein
MQPLAISTKSDLQYVGDAVGVDRPDVPSHADVGNNDRSNKVGKSEKSRKAGKEVVVTKAV